MITEKQALGIVFRLSIVVAVGYAMVDAYHTYSLWNREQLSFARGKAVMECAAKLPEDWIKSNANNVGNVDVAPLCGAGEDGQTFFTNATEINQFRAGGYESMVTTWQKPFDVIKTGIAFTFAFIAINLLGLLLIGCYQVARWVFKG